MELQTQWSIKNIIMKIIIFICIYQRMVDGLTGSGHLAKQHVDKQCSLVTAAVTTLSHSVGEVTVLEVT